MEIKEELKTAITVVLAVVMWAACLDLYAGSFANAANHWSDITYYFKGENPEGGTLAYPAGALAYFSILRHLFPDVQAFAYAFEIMSFIWFAMLFFFYGRMHNPERLVKISLIFAFLFGLVVLRVEIVAITLAFIGVWLFSRGDRMAGWVLVIIAAFVKIFPAFLVPILLMVEMKDWGGRKRIAVAALFGLALLFSSDATLNALSYQANRGVEIESIYANILFLANMLNPLGIEVGYSFGSYNVVLPDSLSWAVPLATTMQILAVLAVAAAFFFEKKKEERLWEYCFLVLAAAVFMAKISSAQFVLWPLAFTVPLMAKREFGKLFPLCIAFSFASMTVFPIAWHFLVDMDPYAVVALTVKNALLFGIIVYVAKGTAMQKGGRLNPTESAM